MAAASSRSTLEPIFTIALHQENAHWKSEGYVWQKQSKPAGVEIPQRSKYNVDRNQKGMNRDQHTHQEHNIQYTVQFEANARQNIANDEAERDDQDNGQAPWYEGCSTSTVPDGNPGWKGFWCS